MCVSAPEPSGCARTRSGVSLAPPMPFSYAHVCAPLLLSRCALQAKVERKVDEKMAKVDEQIDRVATMRKKAPSTGGGAPTPPTTPPPAVAAAAAAPASAAAARTGGTLTPSATDAAKAFDSVPKGELVALLVKTNGRCKQLESRYAELKQLHEALLEEKRQLVATRGRSNGGSAETERARLEATLRQSYEDRLQELEEQASASGSIKNQLQSELSALGRCEAWSGIEPEQPPAQR